MKFTCPHCKVPFDTKGLPLEAVTKNPSGDVECPSCGTNFRPVPASRERKGKDPYPKAISTQGQEAANRLMDMLKEYDQGVAQSALWHLQRMLLPKHTATIKVGLQEHMGRRDDPPCSVCGKELDVTTEMRLVLEIVDRWNHTSTRFAVCKDHMQAWLATDVDLFCDNLGSPLGYY